MLSLCSGPGRVPFSRVFVLGLHRGRVRSVYYPTDMGAGMTNEDHIEPPQNGPLTVHRLKQSSPEPCHPECPLLVCSVHGEPWDSTIQESLPGAILAPTRLWGSLPAHHRHVYRKAGTKEPHEGSFQLPG